MGDAADAIFSALSAIKAAYELMGENDALVAQVFRETESLKAIHAHIKQYPPSTDVEKITAKQLSEASTHMQKAITKYQNRSCCCRCYFAKDDQTDILSAMEQLKRGFQTATHGGILGLKVLTQGIADKVGETDRKIDILTEETRRNAEEAKKREEEMKRIADRPVSPSSQVIVNLDTGASTTATLAVVVDNINKRAEAEAKVAILEYKLSQQQTHTAPTIHPDPSSSSPSTTLPTSPPPLPTTPPPPTTTTTATTTTTTTSLSSPPPTTSSSSLSSPSSTSTTTPTSTTSPASTTSTESKSPTPTPTGSTSSTLTSPSTSSTSSTPLALRGDEVWIAPCVTTEQWGARWNVDPLLIKILNGSGSGRPLLTYDQLLNGAIEVLLGGAINIQQVAGIRQGRDNENELRRYFERFATKCNWPEGKWQPHGSVDEFLKAYGITIVDMIKNLDLPDTQTLLDTFATDETVDMELKAAGLGARVQFKAAVRAERFLTRLWRAEVNRSKPTS